MKKINSIIRKKLDFLSNLPDTEYPFITLYMNVNSNHFLDQMEKNRIFLKNSLKEHIQKIKKEKDIQKLTSLKKDIQKIKDFIKNDLKPSTHGMAIFACEELGIFETFQSIIPFENEFIVDSFPHLKQLSFQGDEYEKALIIMLDSRLAKIFEIKQGGFLNEIIEFSAEVHRFHKQGGWAQLKYQRGIEQEKEWHYKEIAEQATKFVDEEKYQNVILIGKEYELKNFEKHLPKRINTKIIATNNLEMNENVNIILENIINDLYLKEKEREYLTIRNIIEKAQMNDSSTLGLEDILELVKEGRVDTLALIKNDLRQGYKCGECLFTAKDQYKLGCPECNGNSKETDLIEEIIRLTLKNGGDLEILESETIAADELQEHGGIGASLRY